MDGETVTIQEAMAMLGRSEKRVRDYILKDKKLTAERGPDGKYHILKSDVEHLAKHPGQIQVDKVTRQINQIEQRLTAIEQVLETLSTRLDEVTSRLDTLTSVSNAPTYTPTPRSPRPASSSGGRTTSTRAELPAHLVSWRSFADRHLIPQSTVKLDIDKGLFSTQVGEWKQGKATVDRALDAQDRRAFYDRYHTRPAFRTCPDCPHEAIGEE